MVPCPVIRQIWRCDFCFIAETNVGYPARTFRSYLIVSSNYDANILTSYEN